VQEYLDTLICFKDLLFFNISFSFTVKPTQQNMQALAEPTIW